MGKFLGAIPIASIERECEVRAEQAMHIQEERQRSDTMKLTAGTAISQGTCSRCREVSLDCKFSFTQLLKEKAENIIQKEILLWTL